MNARLLRLACFALGLVPAGLAAAETNPAPLDATVARFAAKLPAGGIVAAEFDATGVRFTGAGAFAPTAGLAPERTIFEIGSITKVFTALLLAETVQEGRATLDDPIAKHLPADLKLAPEIAAITLGQLATHTSGLPRLPDNFTTAEAPDPYAAYDTQQLHAYLAAARLAKPGPHPADYSNLGFGLLGHLLERIHGRTYAELLATRITGPLGLPDTTITLSAEQQARFSPPYSGKDRAAPWTFDAVTGAGAIRSTAADLAKFAQALLVPGDSPLQRAWELVRQPRAEMGGGKLGLAVIVESVDGATVYSHGGGTGGFRTHLQFSPDRKQGLVVLVDNAVLEPALVVAALREAQQPAKADPKARAEAPLDASKLPEFAGVYAIDPKAKFTVLLRDDGRLHVRLTGQPFLPIFHGGGERFFYRAVPAELQFARGADGRVDRVTLFQNGRELLAKRTAEKPPALLFPNVAALGAYVGEFTLAPGAKFVVRLQGEQLFVKLANQPAFPVFQTRADHFEYDVVAAALTFERDPTGQVTALVLHQNGADQRATRTK